MLSGSKSFLVFLVDLPENLDAELFSLAFARLSFRIVDPQAVFRIEHMRERAAAFTELTALDSAELLHGDLASDDGREFFQDRGGRRLSIFVEQAHRTRDDDLRHRTPAIVPH